MYIHCLTKLIINEEAVNVDCDGKYFLKNWDDPDDHYKQIQNDILQKELKNSSEYSYSEIRIGKVRSQCQLILFRNNTKIMQIPLKDSRLQIKINPSLEEAKKSEIITLTIYQDFIDNNSFNSLHHEITPIREIKIRCIKVFKKQIKGINSELQNLFKDYAEKINDATEILSLSDEHSNGLAETLDLFSDIENKSYENVGPLKMPLEASKKALNQKITDFYEAIYDQCYQQSAERSPSSNIRRYNYPIEDSTEFVYFTKMSKPQREKKKSLVYLLTGDGIYDSRRDYATEFCTCTKLGFTEIKLQKIDLQWFAAPQLIFLYFDKCDVFQTKNAWKIFEENICKLSNLRILEISKCELTEIPETFFSKLPTTMESLIFDQNNLNTLSTEISKVKNLKCLNLEGNRNLTNDNFPWYSLPETIEAIFLKETNVTKIPANIRKHLKNLNQLDIKIDEEINIDDLSLGNLSISELHPIDRRGHNVKERHTRIKLQDEDWQESRELESDSKNCQFCLSYSPLTSYSWETLSERLTELSFCYNQLESIGSLKRLQNLQFLDMARNCISHVEWENLPTKIEKINLSHNLLTEIGSLRHLNLLKKLVICYNCLIKIEWESLPGKLKELNASLNQLTSVGDIRHLKMLKQLDVEYNKLVTVQWECLPQGLEELLMTKNCLTKVGPLRHVEKLKLLKLQQNEILSIEWSSLPQGLNELDISKNSLSEVASIKQLSSLQKLQLRHNKIAAVDWENLPKNLSYELDLSNNCITSVGNIHRLKNLEDLNLKHNQIKSVDWENLPENLMCLDISHNLLSTVGPLNNFESLTSLEIGHNEITFINWETLPENVQTLDLSFNVIQKVGSLKHLKNLDKLDLQNNHLRSFGNCISDLQQLSRINLSNNQITALETGFEFLEGKYGHLNLNLSNNDFNYANGNLMERLWNRLPKTYFLLLNDNNLKVIPCEMINKFTYLLVVNCNLDYICPQIYTFAEQTIKINLALNPKLKLSFVPKQFYPSPLPSKIKHNMFDSKPRIVSDSDMQISINSKTLTKRERMFVTIKPEGLNKDICRCCATCKEHLSDVEMIETTMVMDCEFSTGDLEEANKENWDANFNFFTYSPPKWNLGQWKTVIRTHLCNTCKIELMQKRNAINKIEEKPECKKIRSNEVISAKDVLALTNANSMGHIETLKNSQNSKFYPIDEPYGSSSHSGSTILNQPNQMETSTDVHMQEFDETSGSLYEVMPTTDQSGYFQEPYQCSNYDNSQYANFYQLPNMDNRSNSHLGPPANHLNAGGFNSANQDLTNDFQGLTTTDYANFNNTVNYSDNLVWIEFCKNPTYSEPQFLHNWIHNIPTVQHLTQCCNALFNIPFTSYSYQYVLEKNLFGNSVCGLTKLLTKYVKADEHAGFRSLSWLLSGNEESYGTLRHHIRNHILNGNLPREFYNVFPDAITNDFVLQESDIYAAANLLKMNILVFTNEGQNEWALYNDFGIFNENQASLLLSNPKNQGYNPVIAADSIQNNLML